MGDWSSPIYLASQILMVIAYMLEASTYFITDRKKQLFIMISHNALVGAGFALLNAWIGFMMPLIAIARDITSRLIYKNRSAKDKLKTTRNDWWFLALWLSLYTIATYFTHKGFMTMFIYFAYVTFTISIWQKNPLVYRLLGIPVFSFVIVYCVVVNNFFGTIANSILLLTAIIGLVKYLCDGMNKGGKNQKKKLAKQSSV